jgi:hypothetical protein
MLSYEARFSPIITNTAWKFFCTSSAFGWNMPGCDETMLQMKYSATQNADIT